MTLKDYVTHFMHGRRPDYDNLYQAWLTEQANGFHTGKPMSLKSIEANIYGLEKFWCYLYSAPDIKLITPENLRIALSTVPLDHNARNCHYSIRDQLYKAVISFTKLLVRRGYKPKEMLVEMKEFRPKRVFPPKKTVLQKHQLEALIDANETIAPERSSFDIGLTRIILLMFALSGLRRQELVALTMEDVQLEAGYIHVTHGKGQKSRKIGIMPELKDEIRRWLTIRPSSRSRHFLLKETGEPITRDVVKARIGYLAKKTSIAVTPHGLRRTFATILAAEGVPLSTIQLSLGHSNLRTTEQYIMSHEQEAIHRLQEHAINLCHQKS